MQDGKESVASTAPIAMAIMVAALVFSAAFYFSPPKTTISTDAAQIHVLSVSAEASREVVPNKAEITFSVVSRGEDPAIVQEENDGKLRRIQAGLAAMGIPSENVKTVGYSLDRWMEYNRTLEQYDYLGYVLTNSLRVVTYDVEQAGEIIKQSVQNGANDVSGVQFGLSDAERDKVYAELLKSAASQAKGKADAMATAAGVGISGLNQMSEGYSYVAPLANYDYRSVGMAEGSAPKDVSISAGMVKVSASVSALYGIAG